jgi:hypothetical protein
MIHSEYVFVERHGYIVSRRVANHFDFLLLIVFLLRQKPWGQLQYRVPPKKR